MHFNDGAQGVLLDILLEEATISPWTKTQAALLFCNPCSLYLHRETSTCATDCQTPLVPTFEIREPGGTITPARLHGNGYKYHGLLQLLKRIRIISCPPILHS